MFVKFARFILITWVVILAGCATYPADKLAAVDQYPNRSQFKNKPSVYLDAKVVVGSLESTVPPAENKAGTELFRAHVGQVAQNSGLFSMHTLDGFEGEKTDYAIKLEMLNHADTTSASVAGVITGLTLGIIPSAVTDNYRLTAKVFDKSGKELKTYVVDDSVTTWVGIWFIPFMGSSPNVVVPKVWENMVKTILKDMMNEDLLRYSQRTDLPRLALAE